MMRESKAPGLPRSASSERGGDVGGVGGDVGVAKREAEQGEHSLRSIQERKTFIGFESDGFDVGLEHGVGAVDDFSATLSGTSADAGMAFTDDDVREMSERGEVAGSADRTLRGNH